jgi:hypothetical protein
MRTLISTLILGLSVNAFAARPSHFTADVFDLKSNDVKFKFEHKLETKGDTMVALNRYLTASGEEVITERTEIKNENLVSYQQTQKQTGGEGIIKIAGNKVIFTYKKQGGKEKTDEEDLTSNFVTSPTLIEYMLKNFASLKKGDVHKIRFGVIDRRETIGFELRKDSETTFNGTKAVVIRMKPSSFVIAALVSPLYFTFDEQGNRALELRGRLPVKVKDGNSFRGHVPNWKLSLIPRWLFNIEFRDFESSNRTF